MATRYARKTNSLRAAKRWLIDDMELMEAVTATRRLRPIDTAASKQKLRVLAEVFPSVAMDVRRDVLVAANYREDVAAAMLGDLAQEPTTTSRPDRTELLFVDLNADDDVASDLADEEDWSEVASVGGASHEAWVVIQDDWEVVDKDGEKVRTFADVLQTASLPFSTTAPSTTARPTLLSQLTIVDRAPVARTQVTQKKGEREPVYELERSVKSFGARKRHFLKHRR